MRALRVLALRVAALLTPRRHDADLDQELEAVVQLQADDLVRQGMTPDEARRQALARMGGLQSVRQAHREQRGLPVVETTVQDVRFGLRMLLRHRAYSIVAVLTLALGIGTTTTMFSIVDAVMLRPFPFPETDRLVMIWETNPARGITQFTGSAANYVDWRHRATTFADLGAWELRNENRTDGPAPEQVQGAVASAPFFRALRISPHLGRFFRDDEDVPAQRFVAVLGFEYWQRAFGSEADVLGRSVVINGQAHTVVGVMPPMRAPFRADIWRPLAADVATLDRGDHSLLVLGRLADGQTMRNAEAELQAVAAQLSDAFADSNRGWSVRAESLYDGLVPMRTRRAMLILLTAVAVLLVIACVNVASLTLARATSRGREFATRFALGAGRRRLVRQLFTESALLAAASAAIGSVVAVWLLDLSKWIFPADVSGLADARLDPFAVAFAIGVAGITTIVFGLLPAFQVARGFDPSEHLSSRSATPTVRDRTLRHAFTVAQVALALVLLIGSGLLLSSVNRLLNVPLGFGPDRVVTARVALNDRRYEDYDAYVRFVERVIQTLQSQAGVEAAGLSSSVPFDGAYTVMQVRSPADRDARAAEGVLSQWRVIGGDYLRAVGIPLVDGRTFTDADSDGIPRVTIISQELARAVFGDANPIGRDILVGDARRPYRVIGIAGAARLTALDARPEPTMYFHYRQFWWPAMAIAARSAGSPEAIGGAIRTAVAAADPSQPVFAERRLDAAVDLAASSPRMNATLLSIFAGLALLLAAIGIYGSLSYAALQRASEMSLRLALGARPSSVFLLMVWSGARVAAAGLLAGLITAIAAAGSLDTLVFEVSTLDPVVYGTATGCVFVVAAAACLLPARRAMRADPTAMLRRE